MSKLSQGNLFPITADELTRLSEDRPANPPASLASDEAPPTIAGSGLSICAWCLKSTTRKNGRSCGCWRRTLAACLASTLRDFNSANGLRVSLRLEVTRSCPSSWLLRTLARRTEENECGSWPTARASDGEKGGSMTPTGQTPDGKKRQVDLNYAVRRWPTPKAQINQDCPSERQRKSPNLESFANMWPTPTVDGNTNRKGATAKSGDGLRTAAVNSWPTPTAIDSGTGRTNRSASPGATDRPTLALMLRDGQPDQESHSTNGKSRESSLTGALLSQFRYLMRIQDIGEVLLVWSVKSAARLNPRWVLQLMGFPSDWLDGVSPPSKRVATRSSRNARKC